MTAIDLHAHILPRSAARAHEAGRDWFGTTLTRNADGTTTLTTGERRTQLSAMPQYWIEHADRIGFMDEDGIDLQVLSLNPQFFQDDQDPETALSAMRAVNDEIAETVSARPDRFAGLGALPLQSAAHAIPELKRLIKSLGLKGIIVPSHVNGRNWDDPELETILAALERLGGLLFIHPLNTRIGAPLARHHLKNLIGNPLDTTIAASSLILGGVLDRLPDLDIVLAHAGGYLPFAVGRFDHAYALRDDVGANARGAPSSYLRRFHYDCISHSDAGLRFVLDAVGSDRIVIGTDFPADMGLPRPVQWLEGRTYLDPADLDAIKSGNADRLLKLSTLARQGAF